MGVNILPSNFILFQTTPDAIHLELGTTMLTIQVRKE